MGMGGGFHITAHFAMPCNPQGSPAWISMLGSPGGQVKKGVSGHATPASKFFAIAIQLFTQNQDT